ncbi:replication factor A protein 3-domain-containing protein [Xylariomycetidae sp. FL0641]|nr:replication factor A protein 3-domain-containing protein [Xylariomycetidae sp. FL0641]
MESVSTPRISATMLQSYVSQNVIIVGKVVQLRGETAIVDADGQVTAHLNRECHLMSGNGAQIIGKVNPDLSIRVFNAMDLGDGVDYQVAQAVVEVTHQHRDLFITICIITIANSIVLPVSQIVYPATAFIQAANPSTPKPTRAYLPETFPFAVDSGSELLSDIRTRQSSGEPSIPAEHPGRTTAAVIAYTDRCTQTELSFLPSQSSPAQSSPPTAATSSHQPKTPKTPDITAGPPYPSPPATLSSPLSTRKRGRLFRTRSGCLVTAAELRARREQNRRDQELDAELLRVVLEDIGVGEPPSVAVALDGAGRWRVVMRRPRDDYDTDA